MDFALPTLFVVPVGNTIPTTGSTQNLAAGQFGIFRNDYTVATAANLASSVPPYIYLAQGRQFPIPGVGTKRSDKIAANKIKEWYVVTGEPQAALQLTEVNNFTLPCGVEITITFRIFSSYVETGFFNGLTRSITVPTPCCACGSNPCTTVDPQALVDRLVVAFNQDQMLPQLLTASRVGTGVNSTFAVQANPLTKYGVPCDIAAFPFEFDRIYFYTYAFEGAQTTQDFLVSPDACSTVATVGIAQRSTYPKGTDAEVLQLETNYNSYQNPYKSLFRAGGRGAGYNGTFEDFVTPGTIYDQLYLRYYIYDARPAWDPVVVEDSEDIIEIPQAQTAAIQTILAAYLGNPAVASGTAITTTTSTSTTTTSSTTSTTTTGQEP